MAASRSVSVVIPALNEAGTVGRCVASALSMDPRPLEVLVIVARGTTDGTARAARRAGATRVVEGAPRGRAVQQNIGADRARGDILCFLHADTVVSPNLVGEARRVLSHPAVVLGACRPTIVDDTKGKRPRVMRFVTWHNRNKSWLYPTLFRPWDAARGLRLVFGDQALFCRRADFVAVGGFAEELAIMEDADLCRRLHALWSPAARRAVEQPGKFRKAPPPRPPPNRARGIVVQTPRADAVTSGRRIIALGGEAKSTLVHFAMGLGWFLGVPSPALKKAYHTMYGGDRPR